MSYSIDEIEGIGPEYKKMLAVANIQTTDDLLRECGSKSGRANSAKISGITETQLLDWVNRADLMRINGVGEEYSDLLEVAGVDTVKELATRTAETVQEWIDEAGTMEAMVSH